MTNTMDILGRIAYEFTKAQPMLPTYVHVLFSALFSIYIGAHASLSRPFSAATPAKTEKGGDGEDDEETHEDELKMEGLSPVDAIMFPLLAGCTLAGLYFLIKWLDDPALLNKILNWYFSVFGVLSVARLLTDSMGVATSFAFPRVYTKRGQVWKVDQNRRKVKNLSNLLLETGSPLPGWFSAVELSTKWTGILWTLREVPSQRFRIHAYIHKVVDARLRIGPQGFVGLIFATSAVLFFNLVDKPWWLTNLLGVSFAYSALQLMSPTTFWTGNMVLVALFFYDIYFVFFTPLMVTVAKKLDIPAKLLFPRPPGPHDDPSKPSLAMLGLGDIVLPGIMIGLALRFDLYLFYLRKQSIRAIPKEEALDTEKVDDELVKVKWEPAVGGWGERFWTGRNINVIKGRDQGGIFPKHYFYASLGGYCLGMITTLGIMQIYGHAQPALLYLVPGVLSFLWGTALIKGDIHLMWEYNEANEEESKEDSSKDSNGVNSIFSPSRQEKIIGRLEKHAIETSDLVVINKKPEERQAMGSKTETLDKKEEGKLFSFSISLPKTLGSKSGSQKQPSKKADKAARPSLEDELRMASEEDIMTFSSSGNSSPRRRPTAEKEKEPAEKRQKRE